MAEHSNPKHDQGMGGQSYFRKTIGEFTMLDQAELDRLLALGKIQSVPTGGAFLAMGKVAKHSAFLLKGMMKSVWSDQDGNERTTELFEPGDFIANCESYNKQEGSKYQIEALMEAELLVFPSDDMAKLAQSNIKYMELGTVLTQKSLYKKEEHTHIISFKKPIDRYMYIVENRHELLQQISLTELAKYLYLTRETVSRCRLGYLNMARLKCD